MEKLMELAASQHSLVRSDQLPGVEITRDQARTLVRKGVLDRPARGVYRVAGSRSTWRQRVLLNIFALGEGAAASHQTSAALLEVSGYREGGLIHVTQQGHPSRVLVSGRLHETSNLPPDHVGVIDGIPVTVPARLAFDLCQVLGDKAAGRAVDDLLNRELLDIPDLELVLATLAKRGRDGTRRMRRLLDARGAGFVPSESALEDLAIAVLEAAGIEAPSRQITIADTQAPIGRVDLVWLRAKFVLEVDSRRWHAGWSATVEDRRRDARLTAAGWRILRVTYWQLTQEPEEFVRAVRAVLARAAA